MPSLAADMPACEDAPPAVGGSVASQPLGEMPAADKPIGTPSAAEAEPVGELSAAVPKPVGEVLAPLPQSQVDHQNQSQFKLGQSVVAPPASDAGVAASAPPLGGGGDSSSSSSSNLNKSDERTSKQPPEVVKFRTAISDTEAALANLRLKRDHMAAQLHSIDRSIARGVDTQDAQLAADLERECREMERAAEDNARGRSPTLGTIYQARNRLHHGHQLTLLDQEHDRHASILTLQQLTASIRDTEAAVHAMRVSDVAMVANPYCQPDPELACELMAAQATESEEEMCADTLYVRMDMERSDGLEPEAFFNIRAIDTKQRRLQATATDLRLQDPSGKVAVTKGAIVDSGAVRCAIDYAELRRLFPNSAIQPTQREFKDASGNRMSIVGEVELAFWLGDLLLWTTVYVFRKLGAGFLLGVNALYHHGLTISSYRGVLFSEKPEATPASQVPLSMAICTIAADEPPHRTPPKDQFQHRCPCDSISLACDLDDMCLNARSHSSSGIQNCYSVQPTDACSTNCPEPEKVTEVRVVHRVVIKPGETVVVPLAYGELHKGPETTAEVEVDEIFLRSNPQLTILPTSYHSTLNLHANMKVHNRGSQPCKLRGSTLVGRAVYHHKRPRGPPRRAPSEVLANVSDAHADAAVPFSVKRIYRASGLEWKCIGSSPPGKEVEFSDGKHWISDHYELDCPALATALPGKTTFGQEEWEAMAIRPRLLLNHFVRASDGKCYAPTSELEFKDGGRPRNREQLHEIGFSLDKAIDPSKPRREDGTYPPLAEALKAQLYEVALEYWYIWARDARAPDISRLVVIEIPTGGAAPIAQKPYPLPYSYLDAVREELQTLIDAGLVEPCISNWASPVLVRLKKDSTPDKVRLKLICDFRRLNEVTVPDAAGLGDQEEIIDGFGGDQRWAGICDAAGGFYQLLIHPKDRHKTAICLPTSMGGTQFQWRVAPYGLTRNPAGYSRGMMFALKGLNHCPLDGGRAHGGSASWIDDISMHASSFEGFLDLFRRILTRLAFAGMSLKATKCFLLHQRLEVLGFYITPDGVVMQPEAIERIERRSKDGSVTVPSNVKEIRTFLGAVQFYRRFVPRIAMLAAPMNELLKKASPGDPRFISGTPEHTAAWDSVRQSFEAIMLFMRSSAMVSAPDLSDPLAEYVIVCDACDIAAGGALLQWQYPGGRGPSPPDGTPLRGAGPDPLVQSWRLEAGWKLRTIGYFHKTFNSAQINYNTFDQEGAAILTCCRRWAKIITGRPTTLYTDSAVAATMLTKHLGTPRLARWGIELGTFMPFLKIQHRAGVQNGLGDFLSRYPTFEKYYKRKRDELQLPAGIFDAVASVPLFTHEVANEDEARLLEGWKADLWETSKPTEAEEYWSRPEHLDLVREMVAGCSDPDAFMDQLDVLCEAASQEDFWREQQEFDDYVHDWDIYSDIFQQTHQRRPVLWDLCSGEGGYSRGAQRSGFDCYGFDVNPKCRHYYEHDPSMEGPGSPSGMKFTLANILEDEFWTELSKGCSGKYGHLPPPDAIQVSPECSPYSRLTRVGGQDLQAGDTWTIDYLIRKLRGYENQCATQHGRRIVWQIENVPESAKYVTESVDTTIKLCGTMMGHQTFRHRYFYCNYPAVSPQHCRHEGKYVGARGVQFNKDDNRDRYAHLPAANMYGVYSRPYAARGTIDEWHGALGHNLGTFSEAGIRGALPIGYGRLLSSQMIAHSLHRQFGCPVMRPAERDQHEQEALESWACNGYHPLSEMHFLGQLAPDTALGQLDSMLLAKDDSPPQTSAAPRRAPYTINTDDAARNLQEAFDSAPTPFTEAAPAFGDELCDDVVTDGISVNPYVVTREHQLADPIGARLIALIENSKSAGPLWELINGVLHRRGFDTLGEAALQVYVPANGRPALLGQYHYANHRGHKKLLPELSKSYYWPNMASDCATFTATCSVCAPLAAKPLNKVATNPIPTPARPFTVIHVDHADFRGRQSGPLKYKYILVVTCALTRFTLFIPVTSSTAEDTTKALSAKVFCIFGPPLIIVSDNGPAFISEMNGYCSQFWGYRHINILPYNSQANGTAESAVKRIKLLLDRHCQGHKSWHVLLPVLQLKLNADNHAGTGMSPYAALFGREPVGLEQLENPSLYPELPEGAGFLSELRGRMQQAHETLRLHSDALKKAHADEQNARMHAQRSPAKHGIVEAGSDEMPKYAWLLHGSKAQAAYLAKHGHGLPWKHRYKVLDARPHAVRLEVPKDGSVPRVNEWQLRRRVAPAPANLHGLPEDAPVITEAGVLLPGSSASMPLDVDGDVFAGDENAYDIERISHAERVGRYYKVWIKWQGHDELTWRWRHELVKETTNDEILQGIENAVSAERVKRTTQSGNYAEEEDEFDEGAPDTHVDEPLGRGAPRDRQQPDRLVFHVAEADWARVLSTAHDLSLRRLRATMAFLSPVHEYEYLEPYNGRRIRCN